MYRLVGLVGLVGDVHGGYTEGVKAFPQKGTPQIPPSQVMHRLFFHRVDFSF